MNKLKRNKTLDGLLTGYTQEQIHIFNDIFKDTMAVYKKCETKDFIFTSTEAENIISALKSMPGFNMEKFMMILISMVAPESNLTGYETFVNTLSVIYYMLSITNPELFEEETDGKSI